MTFERITSHSRRVNPRRDPFIGRGQRLRTSDGPRANHPMELTESRAGARASVAHLESYLQLEKLDDRRTPYHNGTKGAPPESVRHNKFPASFSDLF